VKDGVVMKAMKERVAVLAEAAERVALWNEFRSDNFQDSVARLVNDARESWRGRDGDLPKRGSDAMFDALMGLADESDASPIAVRDVCAEAFRAAEEGARAA
jgi:hypothetical protein